MNIILDGFGHYGADATGSLRMLDGAYLAVSADVEPTTDNPRTGTYALHCDGPVQNPAWRRALPSSRTTVFMSLAHYVENLPTNSERYAFAQFLTGGNAPIITFGLSTTGQVQIRDGSVTATVLAESDPEFVAGVFQHVECMVRLDGASSVAECRINGVTVASYEGVITQAGPVGQISAGGVASGGHGITSYDHADLRVGDDLGGINDDFMGDRRVYTRMPVADGPVSEWEPDSGSNRWSRVDEIPPDGDTSFIQSPDGGSRQQLRFEAVPAEVELVGGIAFVSYAKKTDAGDCLMASNVVSGGETDLGEVQAPSVDYSYLDVQCFDVDPNGDIPWTPDSVDAAYSELEHIGESGA